MSANVRIEKQARITTIRIDRPEKKNSLTAEMYAAMADALRDADADPAVRVVVFTGAEGTFTAGHNIADFVERPPRSRNDPVFRFIYQLPATRVPIVAAVDGMAVGVGTTMLPHCDLVYATARATFLLPFVNLGVVPEAGSSLLLPLMAGYQRAAELILLGEPFDAAKAVEIGLVNRLCEPEELESVAMEAAVKLAAKPRDALIASKALMRRPLESVEARMSVELMEFAARLDSPQSREALTAFMERRAPDFDQFD